MITIEATDKKTKAPLGELCLTDPHDGESRERNTTKTNAWKAEIEATNPDTEIAYACYFD